MESILSKVFANFYSYDQMRPAMLNPFIVGDKTYATDGYTLVRCNTENIDFEYENKEEPLKVERVIPKINTSQIIDIDSIDWASFMNKDEMVGDGSDDVECGHCKGEGTCEESFYYKGERYTAEYDCPVCDGSGFEEEEKQIPTRNKTFGQNDVVRFKNTYFYATKFYKLKKVKDLIGADVELISHNNQTDSLKPVLFRIGIVEVLIMPMQYSSIDDVIVNID